jgi:hypothetical protein
LLSDIYGGCSAVQRGIREAGHFCKVQRTVTSDYKPYPKPVHLGFWTYEGYVGVSVKVVLYADVSNAWLDFVNSMGFLNPIEILWELLPLSFVIDWFLPIGTFLAALTADIGIQFKAGTRTDKSWGEYSSLFTVEDESQLLSGTKPGLYVRNVCMNRIVFTDFPKAMPFMKSPFSTKHAISALALITQRRR